MVQPDGSGKDKIMNEEIDFGKAIHTAGSQQATKAQILAIEKNSLIEFIVYKKDIVGDIMHPYKNKDDDRVILKDLISKGGEGFIFLKINKKGEIFFNGIKIGFMKGNPYQRRSFQKYHKSLCK